MVKVKKIKARGFGKSMESAIQSLFRNKKFKFYNKEWTFKRSRKHGNTLVGVIIAKPKKEIEVEVVGTDTGFSASY